MKIITLMCGVLIAGTVYQVKFNALQRIPEYIYIVSIGTSVTFQYCDVNGVQIPGTTNMFANLSDTIYNVQAG